MKPYTRSSFLVLALLVAGTLVAPRQAEAWSLGGAWKKATHTVTHVANKVVHKARHVGNQISHKARDVGHRVDRGVRRGVRGARSGAVRAGGFLAGAYHDALRAARRAAREVRKVTQEGWDALRKFARHPTGSCEQLQRHARDEIVGVLSPAIDGTIGRLPRNASTAFMAAATCRSDMKIGFNCGLFPYAGGISSALKQGGRAARRFAHAVGSAARHECRNVPLPVRGDCAIDVAVAKSSRRGFQCIRDIAGEYGKARGHARIDQQKICTMTGEMAFGMALDAAIANGAGVARKAVQYAQKLRSALALSRKVPLPRSCRL